MKPETTAHGGQRQGAGRPATGVSRRNIMIEDELWALAQKLGDGNASAGIRKALLSSKK